ncbi:transporter, major facilitator family protein [Necator americanus]|uniref:Transporter, major facilitator family protein n=1 Tax=Necator americanus TaxID=51031 RepID=W2SIM9_NECAM|nr:transporter, major facilitator family protein [Necator americanus]ETN69509.1 transporter, major facilitator family protein [Necator americanus]
MLDLDFSHSLQTVITDSAANRTSLGTTKEVNKKMKFDDFLFANLGEIGKYQRIQFFLVCLPTIIVSMHALSWTLASVPVPFRCALPSETHESPYYSSDERLTLKECKGWDETPVSINESGSPRVHCYYNEKCELNGELCSSHVFDRSRVQYSAMDRWELVCDRASNRAHVQLFYYIGQMVGSFVFGLLGDRIGRKKVCIIAIAMQVSCGLASVFAPTWWLFAILRTGIGFSHPGIFVIAVVVGMELVGPKYRKMASVITGGFFALGQACSQFFSPNFILLGVEGNFVTNYQHLQLLITLPGILFLSYWWLVPESPRWLVAQRSYEEADKILRRAAKINGVTLPEKWWEQLDSEIDPSDKKSRKYKAWDLFKTPILRKRALVAFFLWPCVSMVYYGMALKPNVLGGDMYLNFIFAALVEIPALIIVCLTIDRIGRRIVTSAGYFLAGACLLVNFFLGDNVPLAVSIIQMMISRGAITGTYAAIYTYTPELFPTVIRNTAMGVCSMIARIGAISATYLSLWIAETPNGKVYMIIPFACMAITAAALTLFVLPETMGTPLPETIAQVEGDEEPLPQELEPLRTKESEETRQQLEPTSKNE